MNPAAARTSHCLQDLACGSAVPRCGMDFGRLIRVRWSRGEPKAAAYIVAIKERDAAIAFVKRRIADPDDHVEDLGRVGDALLKTLGLGPGQFVRADRLHHV